MKIYGITGWKNCGKTGLMERLVSHFTMHGLTVSTIKHAHHSTDVDQPGTDSHRHRQAGASEVILASRHRVAVMQELRRAEEPPLADLLARLSPVDLVLVEGYKREDLRAALNDGVRKVVMWTSRHKATDAMFANWDYDPFFNINRPEDLQKAEAMLAEHS